jgi:tetratricopeptide (TPR) repeat protein
MMGTLRGFPSPPALAPRGEAALRSGLGTALLFVACVVGLVGCATGPQRITKLVGDHVVVTRAVSPEAYEHVARALLYEEEERWEDAAAELQRALPFDDEAAEVRAELGELFVRLGRLDDAAGEIDRSLETAPTVEGYLARAHLDDARHDRAGMVEALRSAVGEARANDDPEAIERTELELADAEVVALDVPAALATVRALEVAVPETIRGRVQHGAIAWALGQLDDGAAALTDALDIEPADVDARLLLGELQAAGGDAKAAKATFADAIERADVPLQIAEAVAAWLVERGDTAEAVDLVERTSASVADADGLVLASALERTVKRPDQAAAFADRAAKAGAPAGRVAILRAEALAAKGDLAAAVKLLLGVSADAPEMLEARLRASELLRDDGKLDDAAGVLDRAMAVGEAGSGEASATKDADATALAVARSLVDEKRGDAVRAARRLDEALARDPDDARLELARAAVDDRRGEWRAGLERAEKVLAREPGNVDALNFAGFVAADHGLDLPLATRRLQAAVALSPGSGGIVDSLGWVYYRAGDLPRATAFLEEAVHLEPADAEILEHLGDLYAKRQDRGRALEIYRRALGLKPADKLARELTERVRTLEAKNAAGR